MLGLSVHFEPLSQVIYKTSYTLVSLIYSFFIWEVDSWSSLVNCAKSRRSLLKWNWFAKLFYSALMALTATLFLPGTLTTLNHCLDSLIQIVNVLLEYTLLAIKVVHLLDSYLDLQIDLIQLWEHNLCNYTLYVITGLFPLFQNISLPSK